MNEDLKLILWVLVCWVLLGLLALALYEPAFAGMQYRLPDKLPAITQSLLI